MGISVQCIWSSRENLQTTFGCIGGNIKPCVLTLWEDLDWGTRSCKREQLASISKQHLRASLMGFCQEGTKYMLKINFITLRKCMPIALWQQNALESISALRPLNGSFPNVFTLTGCTKAMPTNFQWSFKTFIFNSCFLCFCSLNECFKCDRS